MKLLAVLLVAALFACTLATTDEEAYKTLDKMEKSKFGKTLLDTIALQLQAGDQVEDLIHLLQEIEQKLEDEQREDDAFISKFQTECDEQLSKLTSEITEAKNRVAQLQAELDEKIPIRDQKVKELRDKVEFRNLLQEKLVDLDKRKVLKDEEWAQEQAEHDKATYIIQKAKEIIAAALSAFAQKDVKMGQNAFVQVSEHFANAAKKMKFSRNSWNALFKVFSQITSAAPVQADGGAVKEILALCDQLLEKIAESREIERRDYQHWVEEYNTTKNQITEQLNGVLAQIANLENEIAALNKRITNATNERDEQSERARQKQKQYDEQYKLCEDEDVDYAHRREARQDDREVVSDAIGLLQSHLRLFRKYVNDRMKTVKKAK